MCQTKEWKTQKPEYRSKKKKQHYDNVYWRALLHKDNGAIDNVRLFYFFFFLIYSPFIEFKIQNTKNNKK